MDDGEATSEALGTDRAAAVPWDQHTEGLLRDWHNRAAAAQDAHYRLATQCRRRNAQLGIPAVVLSSVVGTSLFATLSEDSVSTTLRIAVGLISVLAAVLVGLQTFLRFGERAEKHVVAADWYSAVRRGTAEVLALPAQAREPPRGDGRGAGLARAGAGAAARDARRRAQGDEPSRSTVTGDPRTTLVGDGQDS